MCGDDYEFRVRAYGDGVDFAAAWGKWTAPDSEMPACELTVPPAPSRFNATASGKTSVDPSVDLSGFELTGAARYEVEYREVTSGSWTSDSDTITGDSHTVDELTWKNTSIQRLHSASGTIIKTNGKSFGGLEDLRSGATWDMALKGARSLAGGVGVSPTSPFWGGRGIRDASNPPSSG